LPGWDDIHQVWTDSYLIENIFDPNPDHFSLTWLVPL
jgi:hypothetical protein